MSILGSITSIVGGLSKSISKSVSSNVNSNNTVNHYREFNKSQDSDGWSFPETFNRRGARGNASL